MITDLNSLSLKELKDLQSQVAKTIANFEGRKRQEAIAALEERARDMGFVLSELISGVTTKKRKPVAPKYANPADASDTWSGRGRKPRWVEAALKAGKSLADLAI